MLTLVIRRPSTRYSAGEGPTGFRYKYFWYSAACSRGSSAHGGKAFWPITCRWIRRWRHSDTLDRVSPFRKFICIGASYGLSSRSIYAASKAALHSITDNLQMECRPFGVNVMLLVPGGVKSHIAKNSSERYILPENSLYKNFS